MSAVVIKTHQTRRLLYQGLGKITVHATFIDRPADLETWIENCATIAAEEEMTPLAVHETLFKQWAAAKLRLRAYCHDAR